MLRWRSMCRSIKTLRRSTPPATPTDISAAALQFVRKVSGFHKPSKANQPAFDAAVREIADATERLLQSLEVREAAAADASTLAAGAARAAAGVAK
jgi:hypothetical protein